MEAVLDYSKILDTVPCGICQVLLDTDLTMLYANQFYYKIYGYTPQSAKEKGFSNAKFILPQNQDLFIYQKGNVRISGMGTGVSSWSTATNTAPGN